MKKVIDISENWETQILNMSDSEIMDFLYTIVRNGTPLPTDSVDRVTIKEYIDSYNGVKTELEPCGDCVSRSEVFAIAFDSCLDLESDEDTKKFCDKIKALPPVTPQQKMGQWVVKGESWCCSCCNEPVFEIYDGEPYQKYCPSCGAKMQEVENGKDND